MRDLLRFLGSEKFWFPVVFAVVGGLIVFGLIVLFGWLMSWRIFREPTFGSGLFG